MSTDVAEPAAPAQRYGPLVHRSVRHGAILYLIGVLQFILGMGVTQALYGPPTYNLLSNYISDLGAVNCGYWDSRTICSPGHEVFNVSIILLGVFLVFGTILIRTAFPSRGTRTVGLALLIAAGIGAMGVGFSPEDVNLTVHSLSAAVAFVGAGLALVILGVAMFRDTRWDGFRAYTMLSGFVGLIAFVLFYTKNYGPLEVGGMERLIVAPVLLWAVVVGIHLVRIPTYAPPGLHASKS
ncbi:MAG: DUF998 domain-containing protein [Thermoplasmata archaeon]